MAETVEIERMGYGTEAVGHLSGGKAVFVSGAVAGDVAEVDVQEEKPSYARASVANLLQPSSLRTPGWEKLAIDPSLRATAPWAVLAYDAQLAAKQDNVESALRRIAHMPAEAISEVMRPIVPSRYEWGYRNKLEMAATRSADGRFTLGFHEHASSQVVAASECRLGNRLVAKAPKALAGAIRYLGGSDVDSLGIHRVGVRGSLGTGSVEVALWTSPSPFPRSFAAKMLRDAMGATSIVRVIAEQGASRKVKQVEILDGDGFWRETLSLPKGDAVRYRVSAPSFFQVNTAQAQTLLRIALDTVRDEVGFDSPSVADLYSGVGTFSIPLALAGADVEAIELEGSSSRDFRRNAEQNGANADIVCDDVARVMPSLGTLDAVVVDPPRSGLDKRVVGQLADAAPGCIIYISCNPQTLARDVERLLRRGYALRSVTPVDMFPQTYHVECACLFTRLP